MRAVVCRGITKIECRFGNFECLFKQFNLSSDWFGNFECRFANFQRPLFLEIWDITELREEFLPQ